MKNISEILSQRRNHSRVEPTRTPQLDLLEKDETKVKRPSMWNVIFYNDEFTTMDFVQFVVMNVFHKSVEDALAFMLLVHTERQGYRRYVHP